MSDLIAACHVLSLDYTGTKQELCTKLCTFLNNLPTQDELDKDEESEDENNEEEEDDERPKRSNDKMARNYGRRLKQNETEDVYLDDESDNASREGSVASDRGTSRVREDRNVGTDKSFSLTFRDIEDSIRTFDGEGVSVETWIEEFEETAMIMGWNKLQMLVFAKKSLKGIAKLFIRSEKGVTSWDILKKLLIEEFGVKINSAQIHKTLMQRRKRRDESVLEYVLTMREIAGRANIEDDALIQYIIDGIIDEPANKTILYGATSFKEFKKIKLYEKIRSKEHGASQRGNATHNTMDKTKKEKVKVEMEKSSGSTKETARLVQHCFNCGTKGHKSRDCPSKQKGTKCFSCNEYGHISKNCPKKSSGVGSSENSATVHSIVRNNTVNVTINQMKFESLFDTGSDINVIRQDI